MTGHIDPWAMTEEDIEEHFNGATAGQADEFTAAWDLPDPGFGEDFDVDHGDLPTFAAAPPVDDPAPVESARTEPGDPLVSSAPGDDDPAPRPDPGSGSLSPAVTEHRDEPTPAPAEPMAQPANPPSSPGPVVTPPPVGQSPVAPQVPASPSWPTSPAAPPVPAAPPTVGVDRGLPDFAQPAGYSPHQVPAPPQQWPAPAQRPAPAPAQVPVPDGSRSVADDPGLVKDPEKGLSGVRRRMGRKLSSKPLPPEQLAMNIKKPLPRPVIVAVVSHASCGGKSTLAAAVGQQLATHRRDRVIAIDASSAAGGLSRRLPVQNRSTVQTLLSNLGSVRRWSDAREHTSQGRTGLELLASGDSMADESLLTASGFRQIVEVLTAHDTYTLVVVDCDAGVTGELKDAVLDTADVLVVPAAGRDGVAGAVSTMNRLLYLADKHPERAEHYRRLVSTSVIALNHIAPKSLLRDDDVEAMFRDRVGVRAVVPVPFDPTLKDGAEVDITLVAKPTANALLALAAEIITSLRRVV